MIRIAKLTFTIFSLLTGANFPALAFSTSDFPQGRSFSGTIEFNGYKVPLPLGTWEVIGRDERFGRHTDGRAQVYDPGTIISVILQRQDDRRTDMMRLESNVRAANTGWSMDPNCQRKDLPFVNVLQNVQYAKSCVVQAYYTWTFNKDTGAAILEAKAATEKKSKTFPKRQYFGQSYFTDKSYFLNINYYFDETERPVGLLRNWVDIAHRVNEAAFKQEKSASSILTMPWLGNSSPKAAPQPSTSQMSSATPQHSDDEPARNPGNENIEGRLTSLKSLWEKKLISDEEYSEKRRQILDKL